MPAAPDTPPTTGPHVLSDALQDVGALEFIELSSFNGGHVGSYWADSGTGPWERHPDSEEFLAVTEGWVDVTILDADGAGRSTHRLETGAVLVVPRNHWHRHEVQVRMKEAYVTPGATEHSFADDPRSAS